MDIPAIQQALNTQNIDGWLFYDFHDRDAIAARVLNMDTSRSATRRWFYFIPAHGTPQKLVHRIESWRCDHLPGDKQVYLAWQSLEEQLKNMLGNAKTVAMQYSPNNAIPYVSIVDAGTIDLVRSFGFNVVSSADLVGQFEAHLTMQDWERHKQAGRIIQDIKNAAFKEIAIRLVKNNPPTEHEIQVFIQEKMRENHMVWPDGPIVAVNDHAGDPHYEPTPDNSATMKQGDLVLIDLWAKQDVPGGIYYDITWMGFIDTEVPDSYDSLFSIIASARDAAVKLVEQRFAEKKPVHGWQVDEVCRNVIKDAGYGDYFTHRTGHNIGEEVHGNGVHIDNLETRDERKILPGTCFSIEPGIYMPEKNMGFRTEIDVFVTEDGKIDITGDVQQRILPILSL
ncbi:MAG: M24 family metallopeptidase [candidate division KSB1 bacterium]|nr:M24 family metallopeptidase [candidate division KSB1 bacterium]